MKTLILIFSISIFTFNSLSAQPGWFTVNIDSAYYGQSIFFTDANTGYDAGVEDSNGVVYPRIHKTTNAGINWFEVSNNIRDSAGFYLRCIFFINAATGFVTVAALNNPNFGRILKTTDAGNLWASVSLPVYKHMTYVYFFNSSTGYASGYQTILKTTDAGQTWQLMNTPVSFNLFAIRFTDVNTGYISGNLGTILKTTDAGNNWNFLNTGTSQHIWGLDFKDANTGVAIGGNPNNSQNVIIRTTDAGLNWTQISYSGSPCLLWSVRFISQNTGWIIGWCDQIIKTTDGGLTWYNQASPVQNNWFRTCFFTSPMTGYITGESEALGGLGYILKTTDGGGNFVGITNYINEVATQFRLHDNYPNPFNPVTKIKFDLPSNLLSNIGANGMGSMKVRLVVYDITGKEITTLVEESLRPGTYEFEWNASNFPSGIYFYNLSAGDFSDTKRMILLK